MLKKSMIYNNEQIEAITIGKSMVDTSQWFRQELVISGYAGTGKTTCVKEIIEYAKLKGVQFACIAPTHKAKLVMWTMYRLEYDSVFTTAAFLGIKPKEEITLRAEDITFDMSFASCSKLESGSILICDEASMINDAYLEVLRRETAKNNISIILMGDHGQLRPVNSITKSKVFEPHEGTRIVTLNTIMRQKHDSAIPLLGEKIRNGKLTFKLSDSNYTLDENGNPEGIIVCRSNEVMDYIDRFKYSENFRIATYQNVTVTKLNKMIRNSKGLFGDIAVNDLLVSTSNHGYNNGEYRLYNGDELVVLDIQETYHHYQRYKPLNMDIKTHKLISFDGEFNSDAFHPLKGEIVTVKSMQDGKTEQFNVITDNDALAVLQADLQQLSYDSINFNKHIYNVNYSRKKYISDAIRQEKISRSNRFLTFKPLLDKSGYTLKLSNLNYLPCTTVHKVQGVTCDYMVMNVGDFDINHIEAPELLYVGCTRPTKTLIITKF